MFEVGAGWKDEDDVVERVQAELERREIWEGERWSGRKEARAACLRGLSMDKRKGGEIGEGDVGEEGGKRGGPEDETLLAREGESGEVERFK